MLYRNGPRGVLWAFEPLQFEFAVPTLVHDLSSDWTESTLCLAALGGHVYRLGADPSR